MVVPVEVPVEVRVVVSVVVAVVVATQILLVVAVGTLVAYWSSVHTVRLRQTELVSRVHVPSRY